MDITIQELPLEAKTVMPSRDMPGGKFHFTAGETPPLEYQKIAVFGLGYVGTVSAACLANLGHSVVGVDIAEHKVAQVHAGRSPIVEAGLESLLEQAVAEGRLRATTDGQAAVAWADISLVCVGTPSRRNGSLDTSHVEYVVQTIGESLRERTTPHTVVIRSTLLPGTTLTLLKPILERAAGKPCGGQIGLAYNPEFLRESTAISDFEDPPYTVIGGIDAASVAAASSVYQGLRAPIRCVNIGEAEMIKYTANVFHALKITFANEIGNLSKSFGVDSHEVMDLITKDTKLNMSPAYLKPGFAYGGSCLPKDVRALLYAARKNDLRLPLLESLPDSNAQQIQMGINLVTAQPSRNVGILGFSFKSGTDDLRESPVVRVIEHLVGIGYKLKLYDKNVSIMKLTGANRHFIECVIPHIAELMVDTMEEAISGSDVLIIGNGSREFDTLTAQPIDKLVIDLVRLRGLSPDWLETMGDRYQGICW